MIEERGYISIQTYLLFVLFNINTKDSNKEGMNDLVIFTIFELVFKTITKNKKVKEIIQNYLQSKLIINLKKNVDNYKMSIVHVYI